MTSAELISVIIPTRNRPELLQRAVASVVAQTYRPIQMVIIDNVSDEPVQVDSGDLDCLVHRNTEILNSSASRNLGVSLSAGSLVSFLDDDDALLPEKLSVLINALDGVELCFGNTQMVGMGGAPLGISRSAGIMEDLIHYRNIHTNSTLMRRRLFDSVRFDENMMTFEDIDFIFRVVRDHRVRHVDRVVAIWNRDDRPDQMTARNLPRSFSSWHVLCERFANEINRYPQVARYYYGKMTMLALTQGQFAIAWRFLARYVLRGIRSSKAP